MNREIKFRAWDVSEHEMVCWPSVVNDPDNWWYELMSGQSPQDVLMQYTGLKDKNGVEIYEGDIVHIKDDVPERKGSYDWGTNERHPVVFEGGAFRLNTENLAEMMGFGGFPRKLTYEVIGNICENTELCTLN